jgi:hypothetical protein
MSEMSDFQKQFMAKGVGNTLFTQKEFDDALTLAQAEIMAMAIEASKTAVLMEREACAKIVENFGSDKEVSLNDMAELIRNRIPSQRQ